MEYKDFFSPKTLEKLNKKSAENLKTMLGDKNLMQTMMSSQQLLDQISKAEAPYKQQLEKLAVEMVKELYPIIDEEGIVLDAKIEDLSNVGSELDEIKINKPRKFSPGEKILVGDVVLYINKNPKFYYSETDNIPKYVVTNPETGEKYWVPQDKIKKALHLTEAISPESRRRIINAITQGAALRGTFAFYLFKEHLDELDPSLVEKYNQIMKSVFGIYDDENAIAMMLAALAQGQKMAGGSSKIIINEIKVNKPGFNFNKLNTVIGVSKVETDWFPNDYHMDLVDLGPYYTFRPSGDQLFIGLIPKQFIELTDEYEGSEISREEMDLIKNLALQNKTKIISPKTNLNEATSGITIRARAINFPMLVHELIKGLYELVSLQGFKGSKEERQAVVNKVDLLKNEPSDLRYGKFIYDALNKIFANSEYNDPRIREFFFTDVYQLDDDEFISFIENAINEELTPAQQKWANDTLRDISIDLKADDYDATGLDEIKVNEPGKVYYLTPRFKEWLNRDYDDIRYEFDEDTADALYMFKWASPNNKSIRKQDVETLFKSDPEVWSDSTPDSFIDFLLNYYIIQTKSSLDEIKINKPIQDPKITSLLNAKKELKNLIGKEISPLNLKLGKYNLSGNEQGVELTWEEGSKLLSSSTKQNIINLFNNILNIEPLKIYIGIVPRNGKAAKSFYITGEYNNTPIIISRKETTAPGAGQTFLVSPNYKDKFHNYSNRYGAMSNEEIKQKFINNFGLNINETKTDKPFREKFLEVITKTIKTAVKDKTINPDNHPLLKEYSEKTITTTIERWKTANPKTDENIARQLIQRFDQIKSGIAQKLDIVVLPDELKKGNNYLNIDKYSYEDMVNLIRSLPENPEKVKKDAVKRFIDKYQIDRNTAQSYVARFVTNKDKLKFGVKDGLEDEGFTKEEVLNYIPKRLQQRDAFLDPRNWDWDSFEQMLDALFPSQKKAEEGEENLVSTDADKIYDKNGIEIYKGDDVHKCISYNPVSSETKRKKYGWCVTQVGNTNYDYYRFGDKAPTFYFVFDRSKDSSPEHSPFNDQWHAFVIQVTADNKEYIVTGADNRGDTPTRDEGWEGIANIVPPETWAKIKGLKDYFKPINLSAVERGRKFASGKDLSVDEFKELSQDEKILYVQGKASKNQLTPNILKILPQYKINLEGRSTTLANVAIDSGQAFPYSALKDNEALAKRYAIFRFRHTNYGKNPIPLPFVKYLDEDAKEKYLKTFDDNLTFEYIEKFFGDKITENYVNEQAKKLDYLPATAIKYIKDPKLKQLYNVYLKLFNPWKFEAGTNMSEEELSNLQTMPEQSVTPKPIDQKQWSDLTDLERKTIVDLAEKFNKNTDYITLIYALPYIIKDGTKRYVLVPKDNSSDMYEIWVLMDMQGKVIKDNISGDIELDASQTLDSIQPDEDTDYNRIYDIKNLTK